MDFKFDVEALVKAGFDLDKPLRVRLINEGDILKFSQVKGEVILLRRKGDA